MARSKKPTILIVDDELDILLPLAEALSDVMPAARFYPAATAQEALEYASGNDVDVVITDHRMPGMTGEELLQVLTRTESRPAGIIMTAYPDQGLLWRTRQDGVTRPVLTKPFDMAVLTTVLTSLLERRRAEGQSAVAPIPHPGFRAQTNR